MLGNIGVGHEKYKILSGRKGSRTSSRMKKAASKKTQFIRVIYITP